MLLVNRTATQYDRPLYHNVICLSVRMFVYDKVYCG